MTQHHSIPESERSAFISMWAVSIVEPIPEGAPAYYNRNRHFNVLADTFDEAILKARTKYPDGNLIGIIRREAVLRP